MNETKNVSKRTFSLSQMSRVQTCLKTLPWREKVGKANFFIESKFISAKLRKKLETPKRFT